MVRFKITLSIVLLVGLIILLVTNISERIQIHKLEDSINTLVEDRLIAESYLLEMYDNIHTQQLLILTHSETILAPEEGLQLLNYQSELTSILQKFSETYFTDQEESTFQQLDSIVHSIQSLEDSIVIAQDTAIYIQEIIALNRKILEVEQLVLELSDIQTQVGKTLQKESQSITLGTDSEISFELAVLIIIALIIQVLIFSVKSIQSSEKNQNTDLN